MRLGILTDVHESLPDLRRAVEVLTAAGADRLVLNGDVCRMCEDLEETVAILAAAKVVGVWGNHDYGICQPDPGDELRSRYSGAVLSYMQSLKPKMEIEDCLFCHVEPWLNSESIEDLWWFDGSPETPERIRQSLTAVPQRVLFVGHFHRWFLGSCEGLMEWNGECAIRLSREKRFLVGINALCEGWAALYDTGTTELTPIDLRGRGGGL